MSSFRIVVTGLIGGIPLPGLTLHYLQYLLGLRALGHEVMYLEDTGSWYYDPATNAMVERPDSSLRFLADIMKCYGLEANWRFVHHTGETFGVSDGIFNNFLRTADLFINVTGAGVVRDEYKAIPHRLYIDTDPGYIHLRAKAGNAKDIDHLQAHNQFFSFGANIGQSNCQIPTLGLQWYPTVQPIYLPLWTATHPPGKAAPFTTIMKWKTYDPVSYGNEVYGMKDMEFEKYKDLPKFTHQSIELAMAGKPPIEKLTDLGWRCCDSIKRCPDIKAYQNYINESRGEWSIAKSGYVKTRSGWFSERSACYLSSGRPVIVQNTGFTDWLDADYGVLEFSGFDECLSAIESINSQYKKHCKLAREVAEQFFDSSRVLVQLLEQVGDGNLVSHGETSHYHEFRK